MPNRQKRRRVIAIARTPYPFNQWRLKHVIWYFIGWYSLYWLIYFIFIALYATGQMDELTFSRLALFPEHTISIVVLGLLLWLGRKKLGALGFRKGEPGQHKLFWKLLLGAGTATVAIILVANALPTLRAAAGRSYSQEVLPQLVVYLWICLIGPIVEEAEWRGVVLAGLYERFGRWPGIVISSLLFGATHLLGKHSFGPTVWLGVSVRFTIGVVLALVYLRSREIYTPIVIHILTNSAVAAATRWL